MTGRADQAHHRFYARAPPVPKREQGMKEFSGLRDLVSVEPYRSLESANGLDSCLRRSVGFEPTEYGRHIRTLPVERVRCLILEELLFL